MAYEKGSKYPTSKAAYSGKDKGFAQRMGFADGGAVGGDAISNFMRQQGIPEETTSTPAVPIAGGGYARGHWVQGRGSEGDRFVVDPPLRPQGSAYQEAYERARAKRDVEEGD